MYTENGFDVNSYNSFGAGLGSGNVPTSDAENLFKALTAGDSADPANMGNSGNTLQVESLEMTLLNALDENVNDFKLTKIQNLHKVGSTVHQYTQALDSGNYEGIGTAELGSPIESNSEFSRNTRNVKYFQTQREVSLQAMRLNPAVGGPAEATEEQLGTHTMLKGIEAYSFEGNEAVSPDLPNGYPQMIRNEAPQNVYDFKGNKISDTDGLNIWREALRKVHDQGGEITDANFPTILAQDWMNLIEDRIRYDVSARIAGNKLTTFQSMYGKDIWISGRSGINKMYKVKFKPIASKNATARPNPPTFALAAQAKTAGTGFIAATAGTYQYNVFAVDASGLISLEGTPATLALAAGEEAKITITPDATKPGTGYIVCRSKKDVATGDTREMFRIADSGAATTIALDQNDEWPGTAEMLLMSSEGLQKCYQWISFMELMRFDLGRVRASQPFLLVWYGAPDLKIAKHCSLLKNVGHFEVDGWF